MAGLALLCRRVSHSPAGKVWATRGMAELPFGLRAVLHTVAGHTLSPPVGTQSQHSRGSCFMLGAHWGPQGTKWAPGPLGLGAAKGAEPAPE